MIQGEDLSTEALKKSFETSETPRKINMEPENTLPETNISPLKIGLSNRKVVFQPSIFRGELSVSGRVHPWKRKIFFQFTIFRSYS